MLHKNKIATGKCTGTTSTLVIDAKQIKNLFYNIPSKAIYVGIINKHVVMIFSMFISSCCFKNYFIIK